MTSNSNSSGQRLALALGWFSIGLGLAQVFATRRVAKTIGVKNKDRWIRACGIREISNGLGILSGKKRSGLMWARVAGDVGDLALLGAALKTRRARKDRIIAASAAVAAVTALDLLCSRRLSRAKGAEPSGIHVTKSVIIDRSPAELYEFWRDFENLPHFMDHVLSVKNIGPDRSHWVVRGPAGRDLEWDAEIVRDVPNESIEWRSLEGADVENFGLVRFEPAPGGRGTVVRVSLEYVPPAGRFGAKIAKLFGEGPEKQIAVELRRFKQLMETGELARTEGQSAGRPSSTSKKYDDFIRH